MPLDPINDPLLFTERLPPGVPQLQILAEIRDHLAEIRRCVVYLAQRKVNETNTQSTPAASSLVAPESE